MVNPTGIVRIVKGLLQVSRDIVRVVKDGQTCKKTLSSGFPLCFDFTEFEMSLVNAYPKKFGFFIRKRCGGGGRWPSQLGSKSAFN